MDQIVGFSAIVTSQKVWKRKAADFYPTPHEAVTAAIRFLEELGLIRKGTLVLEPACGDGAAAAVLEYAGYIVEASDLRHSGYGQGGIDFLHGQIRTKAQWTITNPPFDLSVEFILRALDVTPNVAMLLKSQYWHAASRLPLFEQRKPAWVLPLTWRPAFLESERGKSPLMDVVWVIWTANGPQTEHGALYRPVSRPKDSIDPMSVIEALILADLI